MAPPKDVTLQFPNKAQDMVAYDDALFANVNALMKEWQGFLQEKGVAFEKRRVTALADIEAPIIVNAAGLGVKVLTDVMDGALKPVQGHLIMMRQQPPQALDYMILEYLGNTKTTAGHPYKKVVYWLPKYVDGPGEESHGVLGGSFITGPDCGYDYLEEVIPQVYAQACDFFGVPHKK